MFGGRWLDPDSEWEMEAYHKDGPWAGGWGSRSAVAVGSQYSLEGDRRGLPAGRGTSREGMRKGGREDECGSVTGL